MDLRQEARRIATQFGIDPDLFVKLVQAESSFIPDNISEDGAVGLTQIMDDTAKQPGYNVTPIDNRLDPLDNLRFGAEYYKAMFDLYGSDELALAAYNTGPDNLAKILNREKVMPEETLKYIKNILGKEFDEDNKYNVRRVKMAVDPNNLGASGIDLETLMQSGYGALTPELLATLSGSENKAAQAVALTEALTPKAPEVDPAMAALLYFTKMGELASQPGATTLGSISGAFSSPADYIRNIEKRRQELEASKPQTAASFARSLKDSTTGTTTFGSYILQKDIPGLGLKGTEVTLSAANAKELLDKDPNSIIKKPTSTDTTDNVLIDVVLKGAVDDLTTPDIDERIIKIKRSEFDSTKHLPITALDQTDSQDSPNSQIAKLYEDLSKAEVDTPEYNAIEKAIRNLEAKSEFNKDKFEAENKIQSDYNKKAKDFKDAEIAHSKLAESVSLKTGAGDLAIVFSFMKMLDPGSVVRESEFAQAQNTAGLLQRLEVAADQIQQGTLLSEQQRQNFLVLSNKFLQSGRIHLAKIRLDKGLQVKNYSLNPVNVFGSELAPPSFYLDAEVYRKAKKANITPDDIWEKMNPAQREKYLNPTT
jgi:cell fate (sporulation/competence/biofilm development) regulator YlbF (YheA/YmcA/DUF963 family)